MSDALLLPPYDQIGQRAFSFYPAIVNVEHNEWLLRRATWSEILVANTRTGEELWIPRRFMGELSRTDEPVMIVGLNKELEFKAGQVLPHTRRVIEMPRAVNDVVRTPAPETQAKPASVSSIRFESGAEKSLGKLILGALIGGVVACLALVFLFRADRNPGVSFTPVLQSDVGLTGQDDYFAVKRKLGDPASDLWRSDRGEMQYRVLRYPDKNLQVILMGADRDKALYVGSVDNEWRPVHAVTLPGNRDTYSLLRSLRR